MTITNSYFNHDANRFVENTLARATHLNDVFDEVQAGFDLISSVLGGDLGLSEYAVATGGPNALSIALGTAPTGYTDGLKVWFKTPSTNTAAVTLNVSGLGSVSLVDAGGLALVAGTLQANSIYGARYNTSLTKFQLVSPSSIGAAWAELARRWAEEDDDVDVDGGYSAKHWAGVAQSAVDISGKVDKDNSAAVGALPVYTADGNLEDGSVLLSDLATEAYVDAEIAADTGGYFESAELSLPTSTGVTSASHGLGAQPSQWSASFRCKTANNGFSVGDEIAYTGYTLNPNDFVASTSANATVVRFACSIETNFQANHPSTGAYFAMTPASNWRLVLRAWKA